MKVGVHVFLNGKYLKGIVHVEGDRIIDFSPADVETDYVITGGFVNAHTHIGDSFIREVPRMGIMDLVGPGGFKQRMLESAEDKKVIYGMKKSIAMMKKEKTRAFFDFRESGIRGLNIIKSVKMDGIIPVILSRPSGNKYDDVELDYLLENSSGIGLSSISDYDYDFITKVARKTKEKGKIFSIHASERIREDIEKVLELKPDFLIHMHRAYKEDLRTVSQLGIPIVITPRSSMFFGIEVNFTRFTECGVKIALGTDNAMIAPPSIRIEMSFAYYLGLDEIDVLRSATIAMDKFLPPSTNAYLFRAKPGEIVRNPRVMPVKVLNIENDIFPP